MASGDRRIPTWAKEELVHLTNKCDNLKLGDLKSRLKSLLESVEAEERKAVTEVFNTYELVEKILEEISLPDLLNAQRICRTTRSVTMRSHRIASDCFVYSKLPSGRSVRPFRGQVDFDSMAEVPCRYFYRCKSWFGNDTGGWTLHIDYCVQLAPTKPRGHTIRSSSKRIITTKPRQTSNMAAEDDGNEEQYGTELWRRARWMQEGKAVLCIVHSHCPDGHDLHEEKMFPANATLGETFDWMSRGRGIPDGKPCPGGKHDIAY